MVDGTMDTAASPSTPYPTAWPPRAWIYLHLVFVGCCAMFSLADRGLLVSVAVSEFVLSGMEVLLWPALFSMVICPILVLRAVAVRRDRPFRAFTAILAEALVVFSQFLALLPSVQ